MNSGGNTGECGHTDGLRSVHMVFPFGMAVRACIEGDLECVGFAIGPISQLGAMTHRSLEGE